jgi:hypothetical protein
MLTVFVHSQYEKRPEQSAPAAFGSPVLGKILPSNDISVKQPHWQTLKSDLTVSANHSMMPKMSHCSYFEYLLIQPA